MRHAFEGRIVVVTGAAVGIGKAAAAAFGHAGGRVYLIDMDAEAGTASAGAVTDATFIHCDLTSEDEVAAAVEVIDRGPGRIDVLVNNAGGFSAALGVEETTLQEWHRVIDVNLTSVFLMTRAALPLLRRSDTPRVVNLGSLAGQTAGYRTSPPYASAKAGVHALTRVLAWELAGEGVSVNALAPSAVLTERIEQLRDKAEIAATAASIPLGRYQSPEEVAEWILFLASPESGFMTGETVSVNGGRFMA
jgi:NAD(P)-dependent dehydrogenase (short-subunit alcohol dehydrogenase family)